MSAKDSATEAQFDIPKTNKSNEDIEKMLIKARVQMLMHQPFFGNLATRLIFKDASEWLPTAATDGKYFYYNRDFVAALTPKELVFLMGHEVLHCVYDHFDAKRRDGRHPMLWNIANDYVINDDLIQANCGDKISLVKICWDTKYRGLTSEEIYDNLFDQMQKQGKLKGKNKKGFGSQKQNGKGQPGEGDEVIYGPNGEQTFDQHIETGDKDSDKDAAGEGNNDGSQGPVQYTEEERESMSHDFKNATIEAAKAAQSRGAGTLPGGVQRMIDDLLDPQIDWRELIEQQIKSLVKSNYTFLRPSRKGQSAGTYLPGMDVEEMIEVHVCIDTSGSVSHDMLRDFLSEIHGIMTQYSDFKVTLWCFDTRVGGVAEFTPENADDLLDYQLVGGGGTDFAVNWEFMKEEGIEPKKFIMFTDGYPCGSWGDEDYCDTIFVVHGGGAWMGRKPSRDEIPQAPFGVTVPYTGSDD